MEQSSIIYLLSHILTNLIIYSDLDSLQLVRNYEEGMLISEQNTQQKMSYNHYSSAKSSWLSAVSYLVEHSKKSI